MGYDAYPDPYAPRWAGYAVPGECDMPFCRTVIRLGLDAKCGAGRPGGERCEMFFCEDHLCHATTDHGMARPSPDRDEWVDVLLGDPVWAVWRESAPEEVARLRARRGA